MSDIPITGEVSNSKLAGVFASHVVAEGAVAAMIAELDLQPAQVKLVTPETVDVGIKLEPEGGGIWRTIIVAHLWLGIVGALSGLVMFGILTWMRVPFIVSSPWAASLTLVGFGTIAGLLLGGLVSLRPDHDRYIHATRDAMADGHTTVVVHALSTAQRSRAAEFLASRGAEVTETF